MVIIEKIKALKEKVSEWSAVEKNKNILLTTALSVVTFFWVYMITGFWEASLAYTVAAIVVTVLKRRTSKKLLRLLIFWATTILILVSSFYYTTKWVAWFAVGTWTVVYCSYRKLTRLREWLVSAFLPFIIVVYAEFLQGTLYSAFMLMFTFRTINRFGYSLSLVLIALVSAFFVSLFNSKRIGNYISLGVFALLSNVNFFVYTLTEQPFTLSDLNIATTAAGVLGSQKLSFGGWVKFFVGLVILAALYALITVIFKKKERKKWILERVVPVAVLCSLLFVAYLGSNWLYSTLLLYNGHVKYGFIGNFYITMDDRINMPSDAANYVIEDENNEGDYNPNVIIIMNEAFSDMGTTFDLPLSEDPLEYYHSLQENYPHGVTYSSVRGNNTCSSEWELLSASPTALTAKGAMIYQNNCKPMRSLVSLFNSRGYTTVGLHPYYRFGYNRDSFYNALGFDQTVFLEDLPEELDKVRGYVTDEEDYKQLIELYEQNEANGDSPFFCFNITMQNHGSYVKSQMDDIRVVRDNDKDYSDINTYFSVLDRSDDALKTLISYFETVEEDTIILIFGDHQPMINRGIYEEVYGKPFDTFTVEELKEVYALPYLIWANYDLNEEAAPAETSNCYLSSILFDVGGIYKSTWLDMVSEYKEEYPIISTIFVKEADGDIKTKDTILKDETSGAGDMLKEYQKYSYGILYGLQE